MGFAERREMIDANNRKSVDIKSLGPIMAKKCRRCGQQIVGHAKTLEKFTTHKEESWNKADNKGVCGGSYVLLKNSKVE